MIYAQDFTYDGIALSSISTDYIVAGFDDYEGEANILSRSVNRSDITYDQPLTYDYGAVDSDVYTFELTILKKSGEGLTKSNVRDLVGWLMSPVVPKWLTFDGCGGEVYDGLCYMGRFTSVVYAGSSGSVKYGLTFKFESISPYAFSVEHTYVAQPNTTITINNTGTAVGKTILPKITIEPTATGIVTINNLDDDIEAFSIDVTANQTVIVENHYCKLANGSIYPFTNLNNYNWVTIKDGENRIVVTGDATVTFQMRFFEAIGT